MIGYWVNLSRPFTLEDLVLDGCFQLEIDTYYEKVGGRRFYFFVWAHRIKCGGCNPKTTKDSMGLGHWFVKLSGGSFGVTQIFLVLFLPSPAFDSWPLAIRAGVNKNSDRLAADIG